MRRVRLDSLLSQRGVFSSRSRAAASVIAGEVLLLPERRRADKPGQMVPDDVELELVGVRAFVSRGGVKLANALDALSLDVSGRRALDVGASTAASPTACWGAAPRTWWPWTSPTASSTGDCAPTRG